MALGTVTQNFILMCAGLLVMPEGSVSLQCCSSVLANGSSIVQLSEPPDPSCKTFVNADNVMVVNEHGQIDETRVHRYDPETFTVVLRGGNPTVGLHIDCDQSKRGFSLLCSDLCVSSADAAPAGLNTAVIIPITASTLETLVNTASRISVSSALILQLFIIIFISWSY